MSAEDEQRYQQVLPLSGSTVRDIADALGVAQPTYPRPWRAHLARHRADPRTTASRVQRIDQALSAAISREADAAVQARDRLADLARAVPLLVAAGTRPAPGEVEDVRALDGELSTGGNALELLTALIEQSRGDLLFLRPDAWLMPRESRHLPGGRAGGRVGPPLARRLPAPRAARGARTSCAPRVDEGEEVRLIDDLPTRLFVIGSTHAVLPEPLGYADSPRLLVRQGAVVGALALLFELYWEKALPVSELSSQHNAERIFLLRQLQAGAKDEQISRTMGISLRTVRRRISELMIELGADTRFQAGSEAARRGWL